MKRDRQKKLQEMVEHRVLNCGISALTAPPLKVYIWLSWFDIEVKCIENQCVSKMMSYVGYRKGIHHVSLDASIIKGRFVHCSLFTVQLANSGITIQSQSDKSLCYLLRLMSLLDKCDVLINDRFFFPLLSTLTCNHSSLKSDCSQHNLVLHLHTPHICTPYPYI